MVSLLRRSWKQWKRNQRYRASGRPRVGEVGSSQVDFQALVEESVDIICQVKQMPDGRMQYQYVSPSAEEVFGWTAEQMKSLAHTTLYPPESIAMIQEAGKRLASGAPSTIVTVEAIRKDGRRIWVENRVRALNRDGSGNRYDVVCTRDVTTRKLLQDELASLVLVDALTGVGNRRAFDAALDREWQHAMERESALSLMLIDIDFFKKVNDTHGHQIGDECIRLVAQTLCQVLDRSKAFVARYGGDELAVLLPGIDKSEAHDLGSGLCRSIATGVVLPIDNTSDPPRVTISCGVSAARWQKRGPDRRATQVPAGLIAAADRALYSAKSLGRNRAAVADLA